MTAHPTTAHSDWTQAVPQTDPETSKLKAMDLLQLIEAFLERAFGDDEETIANSLRGP